SSFSLFAPAEEIGRLGNVYAVKEVGLNNFFDDSNLLGASIDESHNPAAAVPPRFLPLVAPRLSLCFLSCSSEEVFPRRRGVPLMSEQSSEVEVDSGGQVGHRLDLASSPIVDFVTVGHCHVSKPLG